MNIERAKELLSGNIDHPDEELQEALNEALELLESNPELQDWMERQELMDPSIKNAINAVPIPDGLEQSLLRSVGSARKGISRYRWIGWGGAVAAIILFGVAFFRITPQGEHLIQRVQVATSGSSPDSFDQFRDGMAYFIRKVYFQLDHKTTEMDSIENWLIDNKSPVFESIPDELLALDPIGCKELQWQGRNVSLVCFHTVDGNIIHLFIMERGPADDQGISAITSVAVSHDLETGGWLSDEKVYLLVGSAPGVDVEFALG